MAAVQGRYLAMTLNRLPKALNHGQRPKTYRSPTEGGYARAPGPAGGAELERIVNTRGRSDAWIQRTCAGPVHLLMTLRVT